MAGRVGGRRGLDPLELSCGPFCHYRCALPRGPERWVLFEDAALPLLRWPVDRAPVYSVDPGGASVCLVTSDPWPWRWHRAENWLSGWLLRRLSRKFRAGHLVCRRPSASVWVDELEGAGRHPACAGRGEGTRRLPAHSGGRRGLLRILYLNS